MPPERRRSHAYVTHGELRQVLEPILERHREADEAFALYRRMVPLGLAELLPDLLADARARKVVHELAKGRRSRWAWYLIVAGSVYGLITTVGGTLAILRTMGVLH